GSERSATACEYVCFWHRADIDFDPNMSALPPKADIRLCLVPTSRRSPPQVCHGDCASSVDVLEEAMAIEIERKFLVRDDSWQQAARRSGRIQQDYFCRTPLLRARIRLFGDKGFITLKSEPGTSRFAVRCSREHRVWRGSSYSVA